MKNIRNMSIILLLTTLSVVGCKFPDDGEQAVDSGLNLLNQTIDSLNVEYDFLFEENLTLSNDTLFCNMVSEFDEGSYHEILSTLLLSEGNLNQYVNVIMFHYTTKKGDFDYYVSKDKNIVGHALPILLKYGPENDLYKLHRYIIFNMTPSDFQVYNYIIQEHWRQIAIPEFESGIFYQVLNDGYSGEINRQRFHELMDILIKWADSSTNNETSDHFIFFKELFPLMENDSLELDFGNDD